MTPEDGEIKCISCHALTNTNFAQFSCVGCHRHEEQRETSKHTEVEPYFYASQACYGCHHDGTMANAPSGFQAHDPSQDRLVRVGVPSWSGTTILSVTPEDELLPMRMNHASSQSPIGREACASCHVDLELGKLYPGQFHASLFTLALPQPTTCADCHAPSVPLGFVGDAGADAGTIPPRDPASAEMRHDAVAWAGGVPTTTSLLTADCSTCHVTPSALTSATWQTNARFHDALTAAGQPQPGSCLDCHANTRPSLDGGLVTLPVLTFDHTAPAWLGDCVACHQDVSSWSVGTFHALGAPPQKSCLPCHRGERPITNVLVDPPFDFGTNAKGVTHGAGQDCALCHLADQDGGPPHWSGGNFVHGGSAIAATTCVACHSTQRPMAVVSGGACLDGGTFEHALSGTGDCFGCHTNSTAFTQTSDWACGQTYPGANLISSTDQFIQVAEITLRRGGANNLVIGTVSSQATLYNAMLHTSSALPSDAGLAPGPSPGLQGTCWHCHTSTPGTTTVVSFLDGQFHDSLTAFRTAPAATVTPLAQPTDRCADCHSNMRPTGIVQPDAGALSNLRPMDHFAKFVDGGVWAFDCSVCHASPGATWSDGVFHRAGQQQLEDCAVCHFTLMADGPRVDVISAASPSYKMKHRSTQLTFQKCDRCHTNALNANAWRPGAFHANVSPQPGACVDCHSGVSVPMEATQSAIDGQWMNHTVGLVTGKDCVVCHSADAKPVGGKWSTSTRLHISGVSPTNCQSCHGSANGGTANNIPSGLIDSSTITSASASTGRAGQRDQINHADLNVSSRDCNFCHVNGGVAWAPASFHARFTGGVALVGRCSNCHAALAPDTSFTAQNHSAFTATSPTDCTSCHQWPGTGTAASPNWHRPGAAAAPSTINVGGFSIAQPPAPNASTTQAGLNGLPHPAVSGGCTNCHASASGGRGAQGYDHALAPATGCSSCHEAGSDLLGTPWTLNAAGATQVAPSCGRGGGTVADRGGDTRPVGIASLACRASAASLTCGSANCALNHFYPSDCGECHLKPTGSVTAASGATYVTRWRFQHFFGAPAQQGTCCHCHGPPSCRP